MGFSRWLSYRKILILLQRCLVHKMVKNDDHCFPKPEWNVLKCLVLSTVQSYLVGCHRGVNKTENMHI